MDGLRRSFTERDNHSAADVNHLRRDIRTFYVQKPNCSGDYPEAAIREGADELTLRAEEVETLKTCINIDHIEENRSADSLGKFDGDGEVQITEQEKNDWEQWHWCRTWRGPSSGSVSLWCGPGATHFSSPRKLLRVLCGNFEHQRRMQFEGCVAEPLRTITAILPGSEWSCLLLRIAAGCVK